MYRSGALDFTCVETVDYNRRRDKYHYIYKVTDGVLEDHHVSRALGKGKELLQRPSNVPDGIGRPSLWTGVFAEVRQTYNRYRIVGREVVFGRSTILVTFEPMPGQPIIDQVNDWVGTAWVDEETFQVVKVVAFAARRRANHLANYLRQESSLPKKIQELAMLVTARAMDCQFIWNAHSGSGRQEGLSDGLATLANWCGGSLTSRGRMC